MRIAEKTVVLLVLLSLWLKMSLMNGGAEFLMLALLLLSLIYTFLGFALFNDIRLRDVFRRSSYSGIPGWHIAGAVLTGLALSVACVAVMFKLQSWTGASIVLLFSFILCAPVVVVSILKMRGRHRLYYKGMLTRTGIAGFIVFSLLCMPNRLMYRMLYFRYPTYVKALEEADRRRDDPEMWKKAQQERNRIRKQIN